MMLNKSIVKKGRSQSTYSTLTSNLRIIMAATSASASRSHSNVSIMTAQGNLDVANVWPSSEKLLGGM